MKMGRIALHLQRFLLPWLIVLSLGAYVWPGVVPARIAADLDPFVASRPYLPVLIFATMFAIGSMLPREEAVSYTHLTLPTKA